MKKKYLLLPLLAALMPTAGFSDTTNESSSLFGISLTADEKARREADALYEKGHACFTGEGAEQDPAKAIEFYTKAAEMGHPQACFNLAACYMQGNGVEPNMETAAKWFRNAAGLGVTEALYPLGICCYNLARFPEAYAWALFADSKGDPRLKQTFDPMFSAEEIAAGQKQFEALMAEIQKKEKKSQTLE
ncbi:MAG: sel1 repeat family protein [Pontiellaceae bacterium]|nr:sel1 repeat family protein [Pontiellaceae bacterium]MBN2784381.1 sel1 repeat family protein [Pontiellaceae bacterium]